jgi:hypothetical protein
VKPNLKVITEHTPLTQTRNDLASAILEVEAAEAASAKSQAEVDKAADHLRAMKSAHSKAEDALSEVTSPPRSLQDKLREAFDVDDQMRIAEEHYNAPPRAPVTASDLAKLRAAVQSADDEVVAAQSALDLAQDRAGPAASALRRAQGRRREAVYEVTRPAIGRLMVEAQVLTELLIAKRAELNFVANGPLTDWSSNDRRQASVLLSRFSFPNEQSLLTEDDLTKRDAAIAQWTRFSEVITQDANASFPS